MSDKKPRPTPDEVLVWLEETHPELATMAELDRYWIWMPGLNLQGDEHKPLRESLKSFGFKFAHSEHTLPSGETARWYCWSTIPPRFNRKGGKLKNHKAETDNTDDAALLAALEG